MAQSYTLQLNVIVETPDGDAPLDDQTLAQCLSEHVSWPAKLEVGGVKHTIQSLDTAPLD